MPRTDCPVKPDAVQYQHDTQLDQTIQHSRPSTFPNQLYPQSTARNRFSPLHLTNQRSIFSQHQLSCQFVVSPFCLGLLHPHPLSPQVPYSLYLSVNGSAEWFCSEL